VRDVSTDGPGGGANAWLTVEDLHALIGVPHATIRGWVARGWISTDERGRVGVQEIPLDAGHWVRGEVATEVGPRGGWIMGELDDPDHEVWTSIGRVQS
jgi:hypothetical protein